MTVRVSGGKQKKIITILLKRLLLNFINLQEKNQKFYQIYGILLNMMLCYLYMISHSIVKRLKISQEK